MNSGLPSISRTISGLVTVDDTEKMIRVFEEAEPVKTKFGQEWSTNVLGVDLLLVRGFYANRHEVYSDNWYLKFYLNHVHPVTRPFATLNRTHDEYSPYATAIYDIEFQGDTEIFENNLLLIRMAAS